MELFKIPLSGCKVPSFSKINQVWAAYISLETNNCNPDLIVREMKAMGPDAIFIHQKTQTLSQHLDSNGINIPVFALGEDFSGFFQVIDDTIKNNLHSNEGTVRIHLDLDQVFFNFFMIFRFYRKMKKSKLPCFMDLGTKKLHKF